MDEILVILLKALGAAVVAVLIPIMTILGRKLGKILDGQFGRINNDLLRNLAYQGVHFVAQKYPKWDNATKFEEIRKWLANKIPGLEAKDIEVAIEEAVGAMKAEIKSKNG